jgi:hypothetical protein
MDPRGTQILGLCQDKREKNSNWHLSLSVGIILPFFVQNVVRFASRISVFHAVFRGGQKLCFYIF